MLVPATVSATRSKCCHDDTQSFTNMLCVLSRLTRLWMAVVGVVVTLAGPAAGAAEVEETRVAFITLWAIHSRLALTYP